MQTKTEPTYRIKPLKWLYASQFAEADSPLGRYRLARPAGSPKWVIAAGSPGYQVGVVCKSLEEAQAAAESDYRRRMEAGLVRVEGGSDA